MAVVEAHKLSHHIGWYLAQVKAGRTLAITERGHVVAVLSPARDAEQRQRIRPRVGGYRSTRSMTAEQVDAELARGFGSDDRA